MQRIERETGLPTTDVIHFGAAKLVEALVAHRRTLPANLSLDEQTKGYPARYARAAHAA